MVGVSEREVRFHVWQPTDPEVEGHEHTWTDAHNDYFIRNIEACGGKDGCLAVRSKDWERYDVRMIEVAPGGEAVMFESFARG